MLKILCDQYDFSPLETAFGDEVKDCCMLSAEIIVVDGEEIRRLNRDMRGIDGVTDVLSFPSLDGIKGKALQTEDFPADLDEEDRLFIGSIAICEQRAREQAEEYGHSFEREMNYLAAHGVLHLLGYDHMTDADKAEMREKEEYVLQKINLGREE